MAPTELGPVAEEGDGAETEWGSTDLHCGSMWASHRQHDPLDMAHRT